MTMKTAPRLVLAAAAAAACVCASPAWAKDTLCGFQATGLALTFGPLDPSNAVQVVKVVQAANVNAGNVGDCNASGATLSVSVIGGTSRQLTGPPGGAIPYTLAGFPISMPEPGNNRYANFLSVGLTGTIAQGAYADAPAGTYSDTVTITVSP